MNERKAADTKLCYLCKLPIPVEATFCTNCDSQQQPWKNNLRYFATVSGAVALLFAGLTYVFTSIPEIRKQLFWKEKVEVLAYSDHQPISLVNFGDGKVFVTSLYLEAFEGRLNRTRAIGRELRVQSSITDKGSSLGLEYLMKYSVVSHSSEAEWNNALRLSERPENGGCFVRVFISPQDHLYKTYSTYLKDNMRSFKAVARLNYYSYHHGKMMNEKIPMEGILLSNPDEKCKPNKAN